MEIEWSHKDIQALIPGSSAYVTLHDKRDCADLIKVMCVCVCVCVSQNRGIIPDYLSGLILTSELLKAENFLQLESERCSRGKSEKDLKYERNLTHRCWRGSHGKHEKEYRHLPRAKINPWLACWWKNRDLSLTSAWDWILPAVTRMSLEVHAPPSP